MIPREDPLVGKKPNLPDEDRFSNEQGPGGQGMEEKNDDIPQPSVRRSIADLSQ